MRDSAVTMLQPEHVEELVVNLLDQDGATAALLRTARQVGSRERSGLVQGCGRTRTARVRRSRRESQEAHLKLEHSRHGTCVCVSLRGDLRIWPRVLSVKSAALRRGGFFNIKLACEHLHTDKRHAHEHSLHHKPT